MVLFSLMLLMKAGVKVPHGAKMAASNIQVNFIKSHRLHVRGSDGTDAQL